MICDGIVQCNDGEDEGEHCSHITGETEENCSGMWCPLKSFNKDGCVAITSVCDGSAQCSNDLDEAACPTWTEWENWSECSVTCGSGQISRSRDCQYQNLTNDIAAFDCIGNSYQAEPCFLEECAFNSTWSSWTECSVSCGSGK